MDHMAAVDPAPVAAAIQSYWLLQIRYLSQQRYCGSWLLSVEQCVRGLAGSNYCIVVVIVHV